MAMFWTFSGNSSAHQRGGVLLSSAEVRLAGSLSRPQGHPQQSLLQYNNLSNRNSLNNNNKSDSHQPTNRHPRVHPKLFNHLWPIHLVYL